MEEYIDKIIKRVTQIMYKNPSVFPIVERIFIIKDFYMIEDDMVEFYVCQSIETLIGLRYVVKTKIKGVDEIRFTINNLGGSKNHIIDEIEKALIRSILLEYKGDYTYHKDFNLIEI